MKILDTLLSYLGQQSKRQQYSIIASFVGVCFLLIFIILYNLISRSNNWEQKMVNINKLREETRMILARHEQMQQQKNAVNEILEKEKNFKIKEFFITLLQNVRLTPYLSKQAEVSEPREVTSDYEEISLTAQLNGITMQQLVELLSKIEDTDRVYTKEIVINKSPTSPTLEVSLVIATLQAKP
jgi:hypothetical protein